MTIAFDYWFDYMVKYFPFYVHERKQKDGKISTMYFWEAFIFSESEKTERVYRAGYIDGQRYIMVSNLISPKIMVDKDGRDELCGNGEFLEFEVTAWENSFDPRDEEFYHLTHNDKCSSWATEIDAYRIQEEPYDYCI